jgi:predicted dehydrogenase
VEQGRVRLGFVGAAHMHFQGLLDSALVSPTSEVVGAAIDDDDLRRHFGSLYPDLAIVATAEELYERARPEAIITCADNRGAADVIAAAAERGVDVMKEKPMAADVRLADAMVAAAVRRGVRLMVNWPTNWVPSLHMAKRLADAGEIGRVMGIYHQAGHGGPPPKYASLGAVSRVGWSWLVDRRANGGGAVVDFCSYGAVLSRWIVGQPGHVIAHGGRYAKDFIEVEDSGTMILGYSGGHSVVEGSWAWPALASRFPTMIYGERGSIAVSAPDRLDVAGLSDSGERLPVKSVTAEPLPSHWRSGPDYFTFCLLHDLPFEGIVSSQTSRDAQEIVDAGLRSTATGRRVDLPLPTFVE